MMRKMSSHFVTVCGYLIAWGTFAYSFDIDYEYHYEYKANSVVLGKFPVVTIAKVNLLICVICIKLGLDSIRCNLQMQTTCKSACEILYI